MANSKGAEIIIKIDIKELESLPPRAEFEALLLILESVGGNLHHIRQLNDEYWASIYDKEFLEYRQLSQEIQTRLKFLYDNK